MRKHRKSRKGESGSFPPKHLIPFVFENHPVRIQMGEDGEPWFIAKDVCDVLGISNSRDAISRLDADQKGVVTTDTLGGKQKVSAINESGLYDLTLDSRKPEARRIRKWVVGDVMPALRKTGRYHIGSRFRFTPKTSSHSFSRVTRSAGKSEKTERPWLWPPTCAECLGIPRVPSRTL